MNMIDILSNSNMKMNVKSEKVPTKEEEIKFCDLLEGKINIESKDKENKLEKLKILISDEEESIEIEKIDLEENTFNSEFINLQLVNIDKEINGGVFKLKDIKQGVKSEEINDILETMEKLLHDFNSKNINKIEKKNILKEINFSIEKLNVIKLNTELRKLLNNEELHTIEDKKIKELFILIEDLNSKLKDNEKTNFKYDNKPNLDEKLIIKNNNLNQDKLVEKIESDKLGLKISESNSKTEKTNINEDNIKIDDINKVHINNKNIVLENNANILDEFVEADIIRTETKNSNILNNKFNVLEQVKDKIKIIDKGDLKTAVINLKPESLGSININIEMNEGKLIGKATVENIDVKNLLENNLNQLKETLSSRGLNIENFAVSVGKESLSDSRNKNFFNHYKSSKDTEIEEIEEEDYISLDLKDYGSDKFIKNSLDFKA